jgi:hypothetical protein
LKAVLQDSGRAVPRTSELRVLVGKLPNYPGFNTIRRGLPVLSRFTMDLLYPGRSATKRQAASAIRWATRVRTVCRQILGLG